MPALYIRPTVRKRLGRLTSYAVGVAVIAFVAFSADWPRLGREFADTEVMASIWPQIATLALRNTLLFTFISFVGGSLLGVLLAVLKVAGGPLGWFAVAFIEFFRGVPALLTLFGAAFIVPIAFGARIPGGSLGAGILGLILVTGAYSAEIIRAGIEAVSPGQSEAARSLGMTGGQTTTWIVLPQAFRIVIPPMTNEFIMLLKDTSLLFIVGLSAPERELVTFSKDALSTYANATPLIISALLYLAVTLPMAWLVGLLEKKLDPKR